MPHQAEGQVPRPRSIPEILDQAGRIYRGRLAELYLIAAVTRLAAWTLNLIIKIFTVGGMTLGALEDPRAPEFFHQLGRFAAATVASPIMVYALFNSVAGAAVTLMVAAGFHGGEIGAIEAVRRCGPRYGPLLGATALYCISLAGLVGMAGLTVGLAAAVGLMAGAAGGGQLGLALGALTAVAGLVALVIFGLALLYLSLRWALYPQAVVLEGAGPIRALRRSAAMTRDPPGCRLSERYLFRAALLIVVLVLLQLAAGTLSSLPAYGIATLFGESSDLSEVSVLNPTGMPLPLLIPLEIFSVLLSAAVLPYGVVAFVLLYFDVRSRPAGRALV